MIITIIKITNSKLFTWLFIILLPTASILSRNSGEIIETSSQIKTFVRFQRFNADWLRRTIVIKVCYFVLFFVDFHNLNKKIKKILKNYIDWFISKSNASKCMQCRTTNVTSFYFIVFAIILENYYFLKTKNYPAAPVDAWTKRKENYFKYHNK